jgi:hypothetical protein
MLGERTTLQAIQPDADIANCGWVGYIIRAADSSIPWKLAVVVNTAPEPVYVAFKDPDTKDTVAFSLPPVGPEGYHLVQLDALPTRLEVPMRFTTLLRLE